ncbi:dephospho-CoA kinase [Mucilaginibacter psychrotolerans]|uniref:Dephospho-CoA kinase n=1 Tax=Mucilaginibacter psychrotolerans TaxID=1524096 RepID=A0A4Y8SC37_9SPHI|nr:dephospho-CoA kinase [Mucilaginibacter psychrotolerans]TFF35916.1 dephospho-CoA kinase [Mucilaginibacter psychrotolerans]
MFKVGITGNIGSGKTTVCKIFETLGIPVFYADDAAKKVMVSDTILIEAIKKAFGAESYQSDGTLNRKHISAIVFSSEEQLAKLNALVHPAVFRAFDVWVKQFEGQKDVPYVLKEAAILFESGSYKMCDRSLMVSAPQSLRIQRVVQRDNIPAEEVQKRESRQMAEEQKLQLANDVIINNDTQLVIPQVLRLHQLYLSLANQK